MAKKSTTETKTTAKKTTKKSKKTEVVSEVKTAEKDVVKNDIQSAVAEDVTDKLEDAVSDLVEEAKKGSHAWYAKVGIYVAASILGIIAYLITNFGDTIMVIIEKWLNNLAQ